MALAPTHPEVSPTADLLPAGPAPRRWRAASDEFLVRAAARGNDGALSAIHDRYRAPLERYCRTILLHHEDAEDAAQAALAAGLRAIVDDRARPSALRAWLYRIAHREALAILRRRPPAALGDDALIDLLPGTRPDRVETRAQLAELLDDLRALPERSRSALVLHELAGLSFDEVADTLEITPGAARQAAYEARTKLRAGRAELAVLFPAGPALALASGAATATATATATGGAGLLGGLFGGAGVAAKCAAVCATLGVVGAGSFTVTHPPAPRDERPAAVERERPAPARKAATIAPAPATRSAPAPAVTDRGAAARTRTRAERRREAAAARRTARRDAAARTREAERTREQAAAPAPVAEPEPDVTAVDVEESPTGGEVPADAQAPATPAAAPSGPAPSTSAGSSSVGAGAVTGAVTEDVVSVTVE